MIRIGICNRDLYDYASAPTLMQNNTTIRRRLVTFASAMSLTLCATTIVLWLASYIISPCKIILTESIDLTGQVYDRSERITTIYRGVIYACRADNGPEYRNNLPALKYRTSCYVGQLPQGRRFATSRLGFSLDLPRYATSATYSYRWQWSVPLWVIALSMIVVWRYTHTPFDPRGCRKCSYNLTGNTSGVCPECGTVISKPN